MQAILLDDALIKARLTPHGEKIFSDRVAEFNKLPGVSLTQTLPTKDASGFSEFRLAEFMHIYGQHLAAGKPLVTTDRMIYLI